MQGNVPSYQKLQQQGLVSAIGEPNAPAFGASGTEASQVGTSALGISPTVASELPPPPDKLAPDLYGSCVNTLYQYPEKTFYHDHGAAPSEPSNPGTKSILGEDSKPADNATQPASPVEPATGPTPKTSFSNRIFTEDIVNRLATQMGDVSPYIGEENRKTGVENFVDLIRENPFIYDLPEDGLIAEALSIRALGAGYDAYYPLLAWYLAKRCDHLTPGIIDKIQSLKTEYDKHGDPSALGDVKADLNTILMVYGHSARQPGRGAPESLPYSDPYPRPLLGVKKSNIVPFPATATDFSKNPLPGPPLQPGDDLSAVPGMEALLKELAAAKLDPNNSAAAPVAGQRLNAVSS